MIMRDGRTLKRDETEAETIRTLYDLYLEHRSLRDVKERAENLELRSRRRERAGHRFSGGTHFDRGHLQHILGYPVYAGRIRHKKQVYDGQHPAIIDPTVWDKVQDRLQGRAAVARGSRQKATRSLLAGKLFDDTGDRLTPSHSRKTANDRATIFSADWSKIAAGNIRMPGGYPQIRWRACWLN